jgi:hypothetical protein
MTPSSMSLSLQHSHADCWQLSQLDVWEVTDLWLRNISPWCRRRTNGLFGSPQGQPCSNFMTCGCSDVCPLLLSLGVQCRHSHVTVIVRTFFGLMSVLFMAWKFKDEEPNVGPFVMDMDSDSDDEEFDEVNMLLGFPWASVGTINRMKLALPSLQQLECRYYWPFFLAMSFELYLKSWLIFPVAFRSATETLDADVVYWFT